MNVHNFDIHILLYLFKKGSKVKEIFIYLSRISSSFYLSTKFLVRSPVNIISARVLIFSNTFIIAIIQRGVNKTYIICQYK